MRVIKILVEISLTFSRKNIGLFDKKIKCRLCDFQFCGLCIRKLTAQDITGVLSEKEGKKHIIIIINVA